LGQVVAVGHTVRWMKIIFRQKLPKVFFLQNKKIYLINIFWTSDTHLKEFCMLYQEKILNLIFGLSCGRRPYHLLDENSLPAKIVLNCQKVIFFEKIKKIFLINIFWVLVFKKSSFACFMKKKY